MAEARLLKRLCMLSVCQYNKAYADITHALQLERLPYMVQGVWSENLEQQIDATTQFRKLLSIGLNNAAPPITGLLPP